MKTRVGKIARLPHHIREQLNQRLFNGALGPELMKWLNALPEVQAVLTKFFDDSPINRQNLTEWRQGGYEEWLRHQDRELRIQRISEESAALKHHEDAHDDDLFENSARLAVAELMADFDGLHELHGEERRQALRTLTRELSRLQNAYNRSRWALLAWTKWNDRFLGPEDYEDEDEQTPTAKIPNSFASEGTVPPINLRIESLNQNRPEISSPSPLQKEELAGVRRHSGFMGTTHGAPEGRPQSAECPSNIIWPPEPPVPTPISDLPTPNEIKPHQTTSTAGGIKNGAPASSRQTAQPTSNLNGTVPPPHTPVFHHALPRGENPNPQTYDPRADFLRRAALLKKISC